MPVDSNGIEKAKLGELAQKVLKSSPRARQIFELSNLVTYSNVPRALDEKSR